ncbi:hypothetical protein JL720_15178 [Aureococcus anophagefferens]|nr:hypothetical protein JL720_15178 [Aureococcus anophagefferens]
MKAATAVAGLGAAVLHGYHRSLELRRERRRDFGGVAVKKEVAAVAALFRDARSCERRPDRAALLSHLEMTQSSYGVALGGDKLAVALASLRFEPSNRATTSGQPRFVSTCVAALSLNVAPDAVLVAAEKSALVAERDGAAAEHAHLCQEKVRVLKSSTAKMQDLKATIKQCNAALRKNQKDSNVVQARRKAAELQDRLRAATAAEPEADGAVERDPDDEIRITDGEPVFSDADDSDGDFDDA